MTDDTVIPIDTPEGPMDPLTDLLRNGARELIATAVNAELEELLATYADRRTEDGRSAVVRNGFQPTRQVVTGVGPVDIRVPKVRSRTDEPVRFHSALVPPYVRRSQTLDAAIPWLYLRGISTGQMQAALEALVGPDAKGLSPNVVSRLKRQWEQEYDAWRMRLLHDDWVYLWADGIYSGLRNETDRLCVLVVIGVNSRGEKHFLAIEDGIRESTQSWREVLLDMKQRRVDRPARLAVGDGALGFWRALEEIYPQTRVQRCWMHKTGNVLNYMPKSVQPKAKKALHEIWMAENRVTAEAAFDHWLERFEAKYPKAADCLRKDRDDLLTFYDFPAEHWIHIRTTNVIESSFATIRHRTKQAKGCVTRTTMLTMIYKLGISAETSWRRLRGFKHLAKVIEGVPFKDGIEVTEPRRAAA